MTDLQRARRNIRRCPVKLALATVGFFCCIGSTLTRPAQALDAPGLAIIVNTQDPLSVRIGEYYAARRRILFQNIIKVSFTPDDPVMTRDEFMRIKTEVDKQTLPHVQAYALTWAAPYRVDCMSITSAFAFGFNADYCADGCRLTRPNPYFNSPSRLPFAHFRIRPAMAIAATSFEQAKALIDRGVESDGTAPSGTGYLLSTSDRARNVREMDYDRAERILRRRVAGRRHKQDKLENRDDVLFYFTGKDRVDGLQTLRFLPGAVADHLTSTGGMLTDSSQMSALRWLEAGATGSYGTVVEPCNLPPKFPQPSVVIAHYLLGETLIEAYWKSVLMPGQGIFIGEPLASPFRPLEKPR